MLVFANIVLLIAVFFLVIELGELVECAVMKKGSFRPLIFALTITYIVACFTFIR